MTKYHGQVWALDPSSTESNPVHVLYVHRKKFARIFRKGAGWQIIFADGFGKNRYCSLLGTAKHAVEIELNNPLRR